MSFDHVLAKIIRPPTSNDRIAAGPRARDLLAWKMRPDVPLHMRVPVLPPLGLVWAVRTHLTMPGDFCARQNAVLHRRFGAWADEARLSWHSREGEYLSETSRGFRADVGR